MRTIGPAEDPAVVVASALVCVAFPLAANQAGADMSPSLAQQKAMPVIGSLSNNLPDLASPGEVAFRQGLSELGYVEGQNVAIERRWAEGSVDRLPALAADLVGRRVDLILTVGEAVFAAKNATSTIPIIFSFA